LAIDCAAPFDRDVVQILAVEERGGFRGIEVAAIERGE
jgi:hypothetical protein